MSNFSDFFPGSSAGGGGGGVQQTIQFTSNGTFSPTANGLNVGSKIYVFALGGGQGGGFVDYGGSGGEITIDVIELTSTANIDVTVGSGGAISSTPFRIGASGGSSTLVQGGTTLIEARGGGQSGTYGTGAITALKGGTIINIPARSRGEADFGLGGAANNQNSSVGSAPGAVRARPGFGQGGYSVNRAGGGTSTAGSSGRVVISW